MAALSATPLTDRIPVGNLVLQSFRATAGAASAVEWIATGWQQIVAVVGYATIGTGAVDGNFTRNARGTGVAEGTNNGDVGVEFASGVAFDITLLGRP